MKLTKEQLKKIIKEEIGRMLEANSYGLGPKRPDSSFSMIPDEEEEYQGSIDWQRDQDDANRSAHSDRQYAYEQKKEKFIKNIRIGWVKEFGGLPEMLEKIQEVLENAYDNLSGNEDYR